MKSCGGFKLEGKDKFLPIDVTKYFQSSAPAPSSQQVKAHQTTAAPDQNDAIVKLFNDFDVKETSHHLVISHLDLHICDDIHSKEKGNCSGFAFLFFFFFE